MEQDQGCELLHIRSHADQSHRIQSYQPDSDQLIEQHLLKKQCGTQYNAPSSIRIRSVYLLHYTCTIK